MISTTFVKAVSDHVNVFLIILARISALFASLTLFRREWVPARVMLVVSIVFTGFIILSGRVDAEALRLNGYQIFSHMALSVFLGFLMGFIINLFLEVFLALGQVISIQSGLGFVNLFVPKIGSITPLSQFFIIFATMIFFELNGHLVLIKMVMESFDIRFFRLGAINIQALQDILLFTNIIFSAALMLSLAVIIALLVANSTMAIITKFSPQINLFSIGINISLIICFFMAYICFDAIWENGSILLHRILQFAETVVTLVSQSH